MARKCTRWHFPEDRLATLKEIKVLIGRLALAVIILLIVLIVLIITLIIILLQR